MTCFKEPHLKKQYLWSGKIFLLFLFAFLICGCASAQQRRQSFIATHSEVSQDHKDAILKGTVRKGMNRQEVQASLGTPWEKTINYSARFGHTETWSYGECLWHCDEISFDPDGLVIDYDLYKSQ